jgi:hypothetical protein
MSALDEAKRKIAIDTHLKRYEAAVARLSASGNYEAAIVIFSHPGFSSYLEPCLRSCDVIL